MSIAVLGNVMNRIRRMASRPILADQSDHELLSRFLRDHEDEAFAALVRRHGPMIMGACLRVLSHRQDAEDAFQATFLMLVRKGHTIRQGDALASWLHRVAFRICLRARANASRTAATGVVGDIPVEGDPGVDAAWREIRPVLDLELQRLPAKYRTPMTLCYLEGKTYEEAALLLGCPKGTVAIRLLRGRQMLKNRLLRRGLLLSAGLFAAHTALSQAQAALPPALVNATAGAAVSLAQGGAANMAISAGAAALLESASRSLWLQKAKIVLALCVGICGIGAGIGTMVPSISTSGTLSVRAETIQKTQPPAALAKNTESSRLATSDGKIASAAAPVHPKQLNPFCNEIEGTAYFVRKGRPRSDNSVTVIVFHSHHPASGLAVRNQLGEDERILPKSSCQPSTKVTVTKVAKYRLIILTEKTKVSGNSRVIVLAPVSLIEIIGENEEIRIQ